tara:strand:- start:561 stop:941 length:381 start_codon:yes stop_codon:yes gene_type:complete
MTQNTYLIAIGLIFTACALNGCSIPVVGALTFNHLMTATSALTTAMTGKGVGDIALDKMTGRDCRMIEGTFRSDREVCEISGSPATAHDFKGLSSVLAYLEKEVAPGEGGQSGTEIPFKIERTSGN